VALGYAADAQEAARTDAAGGIDAATRVIPAWQRAGAEVMRDILMALGAVVIGVACAALPMLVFLVGGQ